LCGSRKIFFIDNFNHESLSKLWFFVNYSRTGVVRKRLAKNVINLTINRFNATNFNKKESKKKDKPNQGMSNWQEIQLFCSHRLSQELGLKIFLNREN